MTAWAASRFAAGRLLWAWTGYCAGWTAGTVIHVVHKRMSR